MMLLFRSSKMTSISFAFPFFITFLVLLSLMNLNRVVCGPVNQANSILIIHSNQQTSSEFSIMFEQLQKRGYKLTFEKAEEFPDLFLYGQLRFNHVIHLAPWVALQQGCSPVKFIHYLREGGNVLMLFNPNLTSTHEQFLWELGITIDKHSTLTWMGSKDSKGMQSKEYTFMEPFLPYPTTSISSSSSSSSKKWDTVDPSSFFIAPEAIGHQFHAASSSSSSSSLTSLSLLHTWLYASPEMLQKQKVNGGLVQPRLISSLQTLKQTRFAMVGSVKAFTNEFMQPSDASKNVTWSNLALFHKLTQWTFQETGVLRIAQVQHRHVDPIKALKKAPYQVKDKMIYEAKIETWKGNQWVALVPSNHPSITSSHFIFEFTLTMLDPYLRRHLPLLSPTSLSSSNVSNGFNVQTELMWPTKYGVYTLDFQFHSHPGYTYLHHSMDLPLLPLKHNQYPRYLTVAYPYYIAMISQIMGMILFVFLYIHTKDRHQELMKLKSKRGGSQSGMISEGTTKKKTQ